MAKVKYFHVLLMAALFFQLQACDKPEGSRQEAVFKQVPEIAEIKPQKTVKIKLKRSADGNYSWELSGDDAEQVIQADRKLKESLGEKNR